MQPVMRARKCLKEVSSLLAFVFLLLRNSFPWAAAVRPLDPEWCVDPSTALAHLRGFRRAHATSDLARIACGERVRSGERQECEVREDGIERCVSTESRRWKTVRTSVCETKMCHCNPVVNIPIVPFRILFVFPVFSFTFFFRSNANKSVYMWVSSPYTIFVKTKNYLPPRTPVTVPPRR